MIPDREQLKAIKHKDGPLLVLAGPGSGKTAVLTQRVHFLRSEYGISGDRILVLTFTRAAAEEMRKRYLQLTGKEETSVTFGTFHSVFYRFLEREGTVSGFKICSREEELQLITQILRDQNGECFSPGRITDTVLEEIGRIKNGMHAGSELTCSVYRKLEEEMKKNRMLDFDDMLLKFLYLLQDDPELAGRLQNRFRYILVDEFQDINRTQYEILRILAGCHSNLFAVGDDDQSIYGFRGSDPGYMQHFLKDFPKADKVLLCHNYRSDRSIVKESLRLIRRNRNRFSKRLVSAKGKGLKPVIRGFRNAQEEAEYISERFRLLRSTAEQNGLPEPTAVILGRTRAVLCELEPYLPEVLLGRVRRMTFHGAKGLEFDAVFLVGASEGITPDPRSCAGMELEEERRAFYVAMTRAGKFLHILYTKAYYNKITEISRFVREIRVLSQFTEEPVFLHERGFL